MRHHDDFGPQHRGNSHVFRQVVVITDQKANPTTEQLHDVVLVSGSQMRIHEGVQFMELGEKSHGIDNQFLV